MDSRNFVETRRYFDDNSSSSLYPSVTPPNRDFASQAFRSYARAEAIGRSHDVSLEDLVQLNAPLWDVHRDCLGITDSAAFTLITLQYNLSGGTIANYVKGRDDLRLLVERMMRWEVYGQFCLTEIGHGLDTSNIETTCTLQSDGTFVLHSPSPSAYKYMPPTIPAGRPCVAAVWAQLIVNGEKYGIHPFLVDLNDGYTMCKGVESRLLPFRDASSPFNHSITSFNHVVLPSTALMGELKPQSKTAFVRSLNRIAIGALLIAAFGSSVLHTSAVIGFRYSNRRTVAGYNNKPHPIMHFASQRIPIYNAIAQAHVMSAFESWAIPTFKAQVDPRVAHGLSIVYKATVFAFAQTAGMQISERCGAQGLGSHNQFTSMLAGLKGISIGEGDIVVLCIRLVTELALGRFELPKPRNAQHILAQRELAVISRIQNLPCMANHHGDEYNYQVLPICVNVVEAIGARMAFEAAVESKQVPKSALDVFVASVIAANSAWFCDQMGMSLDEQLKIQIAAVKSMEADADALAADSEANSAVTAPIVSDTAWNGFVEGLPLYQGNARGLYTPEIRADPSSRGDRHNLSIIQAML